MPLKQLSLFLENKPGQLTRPCRLLADAGINIVTLCLADTQQFGILRLIVREWQRAARLLEDAGCVVNVSDVLAVEVADRPGGMAALLAALDDAAINIEYTYAFTCSRAGAALLIVRVEDVAGAQRILQQRGFSLVDELTPP